MDLFSLVYNVLDLELLLISLPLSLLIDLPGGGLAVLGLVLLLGLVTVAECLASDLSAEKS